MLKLAKKYDNKIIIGENFSYSKNDKEFLEKTRELGLSEGPFDF